MTSTVLTKSIGLHKVTASPVLVPARATKLRSTPLAPCRCPPYLQRPSTTATMGYRGFSGGKDFMSNLTPLKSVLPSPVNPIRAPRVCSRLRRHHCYVSPNERKHLPDERGHLADSNMLEQVEQLEPAKAGPTFGLHESEDSVNCECRKNFNRVAKNLISLVGSVVQAVIREVIYLMISLVGVAILWLVPDLGPALGVGFVAWMQRKKEEELQRFKKFK